MIILIERAIIDNLGSLSIIDAEQRSSLVVKKNGEVRSSTIISERMCRSSLG